MTDAAAARPDPHVLAVDVAVVGAGPAGLAAAAAAATRGLLVAVVDAGQQPGGQYWRHVDETAASSPVSGGKDTAGHQDWPTYLRLRRDFDAARADGTLQYLPGRQVWFIAPGPGPGYTLRLNRVVEDPEAEPGPSAVRARALILCPGGYDRQLPIPGWDLPGTMAAGGVQALLKGHRSLSGKRAVVAGSGPFLLPVAAGLASAGATVVGVCEAGRVQSWLRRLGGAAQVPSKGIDAATYAAKLVKHRIPYWTRTVLTSIDGVDEVSSATVGRLGRDGAVRPDGRRDLQVDLVALGWGFTPSLELVTAVGAATRVDVDGSLVGQVDGCQRSSVPDVYLAGEATGVGGAMLAVSEGELAGRTAARDAGIRSGGRDGDRADEREVRRLQRAIGRSRAFARAMHLAHPVPRRWPEWVTPETIVCRCEEVDYGQIRRARDELGATDARTVKLLARPGMGWCQGRVCGYATAVLAAPDAAAPSPGSLGSVAKRPLCAPVLLRDLAAAGAEED